MSVAEAGVAARQPELLPDKRAQAARLYAYGLPLARVAERLGISHAAARSAVMACGGTIRPGGRRRS